MKSSKVLSMALLGMSIILASCSGDQGEQGPKGDTGDSVKGDTGDKGDKGDKGDPGEDKPNVDFYFQQGFKDYMGTADAGITPPDNSTDDGNIILYHLFNGIDNIFEKKGVIRFDNIDETIASALVAEGENCSEAFYVNKATLYVYISTYDNESYENPSIKVGFYSDQDPTFVEGETEVSWTMANANDSWAADGGESVGWAGPLGSDDYPFALPKGSNNTYGWVPIVLPRSVVEDWICNPGSNKGMRLRVDPGEQAQNPAIEATIVSSENDMEDLRPLLVIETEEMDSAAAKSAVSGKSQDWENLSYEEKMAPLYRYFEAKGL